MRNSLIVRCQDYSRGYARQAPLVSSARGGDRAAIQVLRQQEGAEVSVKKEALRASDMVHLQSIGLAGQAWARDIFIYYVGLARKELVSDGARRAAALVSMPNSNPPSLRNNSSIALLRSLGVEGSSAPSETTLGFSEIMLAFPQNPGLVAKFVNGGFLVDSFFVTLRADSERFGFDIFNMPQCSLYKKQPVEGCSLRTTMKSVRVSFRGGGLAIQERIGRRVLLTLEESRGGILEPETSLAEFLPSLDFHKVLETVLQRFYFAITLRAAGRLNKQYRLEVPVKPEIV